MSNHLDSQTEAGDRLAELARLQAAAAAAAGQLQALQEEIAASMRRGQVSQQRLTDIREYLTEIAVNALDDARQPRVWTSRTPRAGDADGFVADLPF